MATHRTAGQLRARRELCALARTGLDIVDLLAERGAEESDAPRRYLESLQRWAMGVDTGPQLAARTRAMETWRWTVIGSDCAPPTRYADWWCGALGLLIDAREDMTKHPTHTFHVGRVVWHLTDVVACLTGETRDATNARVINLLDAHRKAIGEECARAKSDARLRQAKADKIAAERALGTLPGME